MNIFTKAVFAAAATVLFMQGVTAGGHLASEGSHDANSAHADSAETTTGPGTIVDVAQGAGTFNTLVAALQATDLDAVLSGDGPFTVFAPTDEAFAALPKGTLDSLLANPDQLAAILTLHVAAGKVLAEDVVGLSGVDTVQGERLAISTKDGVTVGGANVIATDIEASNGVIHVIDRVLLPRG